MISKNLFLDSTEYLVICLFDPGDAMTFPARSQTLRFSHLSRNVLTGDDEELYSLANLAGVTMDPQIFKIVIDLLRMNVAPMAVQGMLKNMTATSAKSTDRTKSKTLRKK
ncbi:hypothetical protein CAPTEDRAFT_208499 [Capitella teleta]|uniref:Uncharacterized protein n=1 Tax=Capitella teleta TaxID=283909 RepID=R7TYL4_CAPTE|nr:hypothetical protein CAPTEDRAFT_208499 [Capitella teleta]|eukprot:ELT99008.1 hypothetical protein CAPTEDRAFT_208499 [Capitella teleta]